MRLDATDLRYVSPDEFRVLTAVEIGSKNHEVVPTSLIAEISAIRGGNVNKALGALAKRDLVARVQNARYDGYRLTYGGLDYLALRTFSRRKPPSVASVGKKIGVGKESDIYVVKDEEKDSRVLKLHRLGRISFRAIKSKRDYLGKRKSASWMYMSRLAAQKEFAFMKVLYLHGFPVPVPIDQARHCIVMSLIDSYPLRQIDKVPDPADLYSKLMSLILDFAHSGLIHGDFNEFNILIKRKDGEPVVIDFPQMVSTRHENAEYFFNRDVNCIRRFFKRRFGFEGTTWPTWKDVLEEDDQGLGAIDEAEEDEADGESEQVQRGENDAPAEGSTSGATGSKGKRKRLDLEVEASGFGRALQRELEDGLCLADAASSLCLYSHLQSGMLIRQYMIEVQDLPESEQEYEDDEEEEEKGEEEEEEEEDIGAEEDQAGPSKQPEPEEFDESALQSQISSRLEHLRLNKALGNDEDYISPPSDDEDAAGSDSDSSSLLSDGPPQSDFTAYTRTRSVHSRPSAKKLEKNPTSLKNVVARQVEKEMGGKERRTSTKNQVGKAKGHKWKANPNYMVGGKGDGWQ